MTVPTSLRNLSSSMLASLYPLVRNLSRLFRVFAKDDADEMLLQPNKLEKPRVCEGPLLSRSRMCRVKRRRAKRVSLESPVKRSEVQKKL